MLSYWYVLLNLIFSHVRIDVNMCLIGKDYRFYPRLVLAFGYCYRLRLWVCVSVCVCQSWACPHDNSSLIQARITKFRPKMQNTLVWSLLFLGMIELGLQGQIYLECQILPYFEHHNSSAVSARITKFGPKCILALFTRLKRVFLRRFGGGTLSSNAFTICAVYWSLGRREYFGVSNVALVMSCHSFMPLM